jgi:HPt (histidine-containing phosphotransfer) domain-containing protein
MITPSEWMVWMPSPPLAPGMDGTDMAPVDDMVIDIEHLTRMTFGEEALRREVLSLFDRQAVLLVRRLHQPREAAEAAHTLAGAASAIGATIVAEAATGLERAVKGGEDPREAIIALEHAVDDARTAIANLLGSC